MIMSITTESKVMNGSPKNVPKWLQVVLNSRPDPRKKERLNIASQPYSFERLSENNVSRVGIGYLLYLTRLQVLDVSLAKFADLVSEDYRRELLLGGATPSEINEIASLAPVTIQRLEKVDGSRGADNITLTRIAPRLLNPLTGKAFTPIELQAVYQGFNPEFNEKLIKELPNLVPKMREINLERDRQLFYQMP